uniref:Tectonin beta-propeller repeat containing 1b n=1 Tax=Sinocyclocheilus rhinocerous TaxID=307959 RepID=A0A673KIM5_9TELE
MQLYLSFQRQSLSSSHPPHQYSTICLLLELKRVTGSQHCCWGIGCHHQLHLHVYASQVPIRHQEETYENQVFIIYCKQCLAVSINHFIWFPKTMGQPSKWLNLLAVQTLRLCGDLKKWVPLDRARPPPEPYIDISCGGWDMSDSPEKHISLWAVSQQGKLWFRTGIRQQNPEGTRWEPIQVPREVAQVSAGPKDLLWVVLWDGQLLARTGISKDCPEGSSWELVQPPNQKGAVHVAVGISVVWAVTKDNKVWFRRGVNSHNPTGSGWISIGGEMLMLSVGPNDQVRSVRYHIINNICKVTKLKVQCKRRYCLLKFWQFNAYKNGW